MKKFRLGWRAYDPDTGVILGVGVDTVHCSSNQMAYNKVLRRVQQDVGPGAEIGVRYVKEVK